MHDIFNVRHIQQQCIQIVSSILPAFRAIPPNSISFYPLDDIHPSRHQTQQKKHFSKNSKPLLPLTASNENLSKPFAANDCTRPQPFTHPNRHRHPPLETKHSAEKRKWSNAAHNALYPICRTCRHQENINRSSHNMHPTNSAASPDQSE